MIYHLIGGPVHGITVTFDDDRPLEVLSAPIPRRPMLRDPFGLHVDSTSDVAIYRLHRIHTDEPMSGDGITPGTVRRTVYPPCYVAPGVEPSQAVGYLREHVRPAEVTVVRP